MTTTQQSLFLTVGISAFIHTHTSSTCCPLLTRGHVQVRGTGPLAGKTPWDVAPATVRQAYTNELVQQVALGEEGRVLALLRVRRKKLHAL